MFYNEWGLLFIPQRFARFFSAAQRFAGLIILLNVPETVREVRSMTKTLGFRLFAQVWLTALTLGDKPLRRVVDPS